jgi:hypothetical protein
MCMRRVSPSPKNPLSKLQQASRRSRPEGVKCTLRFPVNFKRPAFSASVSKGATDAPFARVWFDPLSASPQLTNARVYAACHSP